MTQVKAFLILMSFISLSAMAYIPTMCAQSFHWDSYGMGIKAAFAEDGVNYRSSYNSEGCYQAGMQYGLRVMDAADGAGSCGRNFRRGLIAGVDFELNTQSADKCYSAGHTAGVSELQIAAREQDGSRAGAKCVAAYAQGRRDYFRQQRAGAFSDNKLNHCYSLGFFEAPIIR